MRRAVHVSKLDRTLNTSDTICVLVQIRGAKPTRSVCLRDDPPVRTRNQHAEKTKKKKNIFPSMRHREDLIIIQIIGFAVQYIYRPNTVTENRCVLSAQRWFDECEPSVLRSLCRTGWPMGKSHIVHVHQSLLWEDVWPFARWNGKIRKNKNTSILASKMNDKKSVWISFLFVKKNWHRESVELGRIASYAPPLSFVCRHRSIELHLCRSWPSQSVSIYLAFVAHGIRKIARKFVVTAKSDSMDSQPVH